MQQHRSFQTHPCRADSPGTSWGRGSRARRAAGPAAWRSAPWARACRRERTSSTAAASRRRAAAQNAAPPAGRSGRAAPGRANPRRRRRRPRAPATRGGREASSRARPEAAPHLQDQIQKQQFSTRENHLVSTPTREVRSTRPNSATPPTESSSEQARTRIPQSGASRPRIPGELRPNPRGETAWSSSNWGGVGETRRIQRRQLGTHLD